jgi:tripartite ATP-independent transporter DctM subunit
VTLALVVGSVFVLLLLRVPVAFALMLPSVMYVVMAEGQTLGVAMQQITSGVDSFPLLAVPLFIMTGYMANVSGIADRLFDLLGNLFGTIRGTAGYVNVSGSVVFSWMSGAAIADAAGLGSLLVPAMRRQGYDAGFAAGLTGASSMIGPVMPPSIPAIMYAVTAGVSIGALFFAGIVPAFLLAAVLFVYVFLYARKREDLGRERPTMAALLSSSVKALPILFTPVIILGGILGGVFTPTEAAAAAVMWIVLMGVAYRSLTVRAFLQTFLKTAQTTGQILLIVAGASLFAWVMARERGPQVLGDAMFGLTENPLIFLLLMNVILLLIGMLIEPVAALLITVPVLLPVAVEFGVDPVHLGVIMILNLVIGLLTPPVGLVLYVLSSVTDVDLPTVMRGTMPFLVPLFVALLLVTFIPQISLFLPQQLGL